MGIPQGLSKFNKIAEAIVKAEARQGAALKGSMFEQFVKLYVPHLSGKGFGKVTFTRSASLPLSASKRTADNFVAELGEIWDIKHSWSKVPTDQAEDYRKILGALTPDGNTVKSINYLFPTKEAAEASKYLKGTYGFNVYYLDPKTKILIPIP